MALQCIYYQTYIIKARLMYIEVVNHRLSLSYKQFQEMGESISYTTVGKYSIFEQIGQGGFGTVYKAFNEQTKQDVAIKLIDLVKINQEPSKRLRDIKLRLAKNQDLMMRICNSPNLVKCYDVYENEELKLMMVEYCNGGSLQDYIDRKGKISEKEAILIFKQILNGIAELHSKMIIHRDLKSENILIHNGEFKIADFGFSKQLDSEDTFTSLGTITNMAPEVMKRQSYGLKADIWSAGVIMFQMIFGDFPFQSREKNALLDEITGSSIYKQRRISCKGITATVEMSNFLKQTISINKDHRIGWKDLINHQIFKDKDKERVPRSQVANVNLIPPSIFEMSQADEETLKGNLSAFLQKLKIITKDSNKVLRRMREKQKPKNISEDDEVYTWINQNLVECLKIQLIYQQIISKIEAERMLDLQERQSIELMYLFTNRCFLTISSINHYMSKRKDKHPFIQQTYGVIRTLYNKIFELFQKYGKMLTQEQNKFLNIIKDFFKSKKQILQCDKYLNGIENQDFKKEQQLRFIQTQYINPLKNTLKGADRDSVRKYLAIYTQINMLQYKHLHDTNFDDYIQKML